MTLEKLPKIYLLYLKSHGIRSLNQVSEGRDMNRSRRPPNAWFDNVDLCIDSELNLKTGFSNWRIWQDLINGIKWSIQYTLGIILWGLFSRMSSCQVNGAFGGRWGSSSISAASFKTFFGLSYASKISFIISSHFERLDFHNLKYERALQNIKFKGLFWRFQRVSDLKIFRQTHWL